MARLGNLSQVRVTNPHLRNYEFKHSELFELKIDGVGFRDHAHCPKCKEHPEVLVETDRVSTIKLYTCVCGWACSEWSREQVRYSRPSPESEDGGRGATYGVPIDLLVEVCVEGTAPLYAKS